MSFLPSEIINIFNRFMPLFSNKVWAKAVILLTGAILSIRKRTVTSCLKAMGFGDEKRFTNYHRVLNRDKWSSSKASGILLDLLVSLLPKNECIRIAVDETIERRNGKKIKAKGCYRDAVRSSSNNVVKCFGLQWISFMLVVDLPWSSSPWALPFQTILKYPKKVKNKHKTASEWTVSVLEKIRKRYLLCKLILLADGGFSNVELISHCIKLEIDMISRLRIDATLYDFPEERPQGKRGPHAQKGKKLPKLKQQAEDNPGNWKKATVNWYQHGKKKSNIKQALLYGISRTLHQFQFDGFLLNLQQKKEISKHF